MSIPAPRRSLKGGALFAGYGGLELGLSQVLDIETAWVAEVEPAPSRVLAARFPDAPNLGDVTKVQWGPACPTSDDHRVQVFRFGYAADTTAETVYRCVDCGWELPIDQRPEGVPYPVEIMSGGSPCQDLSHAGKRAGMRTGQVIPAGVMACGCRWAEHQVDSCEAASPAGDVPARRFAQQDHVAAMRAVAALNALDRADGSPPPERRISGTRSGLWASMCDAIDIIRPRLVVWENVRGALSAEADSAVEPCPICVGDGNGVTLRALGRVLGDLAELGYDTAWTGVRAADVGAPHARFRVFVLAWPADAPGPGLEAWGEGRRGERAAADTDDVRGERPGSARPGGQTYEPASLTLLRTPGEAEGGRPRSDAGRRGGAPAAEDVTVLLPTPRATDGTKGGPNQRGSSGDLMLPSAVTHLLPTPAVNDMGASYDVGTWEAWTARMKAAHGNGNGHGNSLHIEALRLLPTPRTKNNENRQSDGYGGVGGKDGNFYDLVVTGQSSWGTYAPAIARWQDTLGRPAPAPTEPTGKHAAHRLSPRFVEWMMGLPAGWVTGESSEEWRARLRKRRVGGDARPVGHRGSVARRTMPVSRNEALKLLGNGVVPHQAAAAVRHLLTIREQAQHMLTP